MLYPVKIEFANYVSGSPPVWVDWSQYLSEAPVINKKVESENEGEAGVIVFDNATVSFRYDIGNPVYNAFSIDLSAKERYLFRISAVKSDKSYKLLFEGMADFSTIHWPDPDEGKLISFDIVDKLSALGLIPADSLRGGSHNILYDRNTDTNVDKIDIATNAASSPSHHKWFTIQYLDNTLLKPVINSNTPFLGEVVQSPYDMESLALVKFKGKDVNHQLDTDPMFLDVINFDTTYPKTSGNQKSVNNLFYYINELYGVDILVTAYRSSYIVYYEDAGQQQSYTLTAGYEAIGYDGLKLIETLVKSQWPGITVVKKPATLSFTIPLEYYLRLINEAPLDTDPLGALKIIADTIKCYVYINAAGELVIQSKDSLSTNGITRTIGTTKIISKPERRYFWDKLVDGVTVDIKSWITDEFGNYLVGTSTQTKQIPGSNAFIKPKNEIRKELLTSDPTEDTQAELDARAATEAAAILNFYGNRRSAFDLELQLDDNTLDWELVDNITIDSIQCFFTQLEIDLIERRLKLEPVEIIAHDYDFRQIVVGLSEANSIGTSVGNITYTGTGSGSGGTSYLFASPLLNTAGTVTLEMTDNLQITASKLDTIQGIKTTNTPTFNQIILSSPGTTQQAVRADRAVSAAFPLAGGGDLTADRTISLQFNAPLINNANYLDLDLAAPIIVNANQLALDLAAPMILSGNKLTFDYNTNNLKISFNKLDTIQDIDITATPQFAKLGLGIAAGAAELTIFEELTGGTASAKMTSSEYISGWTGAGWKMDWAAGQGYTIETDNMFLRGSLTVYELIINQIRATNGTLIVSSEGKVSDVTGSLGSETLTLEDPEGNGYQPFAVNDIILMQVVDLNGSTIVRRAVRKVSSITTNQITVTTAGLTNPPATDPFKKGDVIVRIGNTTNTNRQGVVYLTSDDLEAPYIDIVDGIADWTDWLSATKVKARLGKLNGYTFAGSGLTGYGLVSENAYLSGELYSNVGGFGNNQTAPYVRINSKGLRIGGTDAQVPSINGLSFWDQDDTLSWREIGVWSDSGLFRVGEATGKRIEYNFNTGNPTFKIVGDAQVTNTLIIGDGTTVGKIRSYGVTSALSNDSGFYLHDSNSGESRIGIADGTNLSKGFYWDGTEFYLYGVETYITSDTLPLWSDYSSKSVTKNIINGNFEAGTPGSTPPNWTRAGNGTSTTQSVGNPFNSKALKMTCPIVAGNYETCTSDSINLGSSGNYNVNVRADYFCYVSDLANDFTVKFQALNALDDSVIAEKTLSQTDDYFRSWASSVILDFNTTANNIKLRFRVESAGTTSISYLFYFDWVGGINQTLTVNTQFGILSQDGFMYFMSPSNYIRIGSSGLELKGQDFEAENIIVRGDLHVYGQSYQAANNLGGTTASIFTIGTNANPNDITELHFGGGGQISSNGSQITFDAAISAPNLNIANWDTAYTHSQIVTGNPHNLDTGDIPEGSNLYYTQARFDSAFAAKSTTDLSEGNNLYYTQARFDSAFAAKSTTDLAEGSNLYFTNERVDDRVAALMIPGNYTAWTYADASNTLKVDVTVAGDLLGTTNQVNVSGGTNKIIGTGNITLSLPQDIATSSSPTFATGKFTNLSNGYIPYHISDAGGLGDSPIYTDGTKIGIGTTTTSYKLDVSGTGHTSSYFKSDTYGWFRGSSDGSDALALSLGRQNDSESALYSIYTNDISVDEIRFQMNRYTVSNYFDYISPSGSVHAIEIAGNYALGAQLDIYGSYTDNIVKVRISGFTNSYFNAGNVGIGITSPTKKLDVAGSIGGQSAYIDNIFLDANTITTTSGNLNINAAGDIVFNPTGNDLLPANNYDLNIGSESLKYLTLHAAELWVNTLVANETIATTGGRLLVTYATELVSDLTSSATTIYVKHNNLRQNDIIYLEKSGQIEFMQVTSVYSGTEGNWSYTVTRDLDGTGANNWIAGDAIVNTGQTGEGFLELYSMYSFSQGALESIYNYDDSLAAFSSDYTESNDWTMFPSSAGTNDCIYFGSGKKFTKLLFYIKTAGDYSAGFDYEYWDGTSWTALTNITIPDFTMTGIIKWEWQTPVGWAKKSVNAETLYWVRIKINSTLSWSRNPVQGYQRVYEGGLQHGPAIVGHERNSNTFNDFTPRWALGNLNGWYGVGVDTYGVAFGEYTTTGNSGYLQIDSVNGIQINKIVSGAKTTVFSVDMTGLAKIGNWEIEQYVLHDANDYVVLKSGNDTGFDTAAGRILIDGYNSGLGYGVIKVGTNIEISGSGNGIITVGTNGLLRSSTAGDRIEITNNEISIYESANSTYAKITQADFGLKIYQNYAQTYESYLKWSGAGLETFRKQTSGRYRTARFGRLTETGVGFMLLSYDDAAVGSDTKYFYSVDLNGKHLWYPGTGVGGSEDTNLYRSAANLLKTDDSFEVAINLINDDIVYPKITISGNNTNTVDVTIKGVKRNDIDSARNRQVITWWISSSQYGAPDKQLGINITKSYTAGVGLDPETIDEKVLNHSESNSNESITIRFSTVTGSDTFYVMAEIQGIVYASSLITIGTIK